MQYKILIVEDIEAVRESLKALFEYTPIAQFEVLDTDRLAAAEGILRNNGIDAVVLDLGLPDAAGLKGPERLVRRFPNVAVCIVTGNVSVIEARDAIRLGCQLYISKPHLTRLDWHLFEAIERQRLRKRRRWYWRPKTLREWLIAIGAILGAIAALLAALLKKG